MIAPSWSVNPRFRQSPDNPAASATDAEESARPPGIDYGKGFAPGVSRGIVHRLAQEGTPWPGPDEVDDEHEPELFDRLARQKIRSGPMGVVLPRFLPYHDGGDSGESAQMRKAYRVMENDSTVSGAVKGLIYGVAAQDAQFLPYDKHDDNAQKQCEYVRWNLQDRINEGFSGLVWNILSGGLRDGYSVCVRDWCVQRDGEYRGSWPLRQLRAMDTGQTCVLETDSIGNVVAVLGLEYNSGELFSPADFVIWRHCPNYNSPTGCSAFRSIYKDYWYLQTAKQLRAIAGSKRAMSFVWGTYKTTAQQTQLQGVLAKLESRNWAAVPEDVKLNVADIAGSSDSIFNDWERDCTERIIFGLQHATLQAITGDAGQQRGDTKVHGKQSDLVRWFLTCGIENVHNNHDTGLIRDITNLNFKDVRGYTKLRMSSPDIAEMVQRAGLAKTLQELGLDLSKEDITDRFGFAAPKGPEDVLKKAQGGPGGAMPPGASGPGAQPPAAPGEEDAPPETEEVDPSEGFFDLGLGDTPGQEDEDESESTDTEKFAEEDWTGSPTRTGGTKWVNKGGRVVYSKTNPGISKRKPKAEKPAPVPRHAKAAPDQASGKAAPEPAPQEYGHHVRVDVGGMSPEQIGSLKKVADKLKDDRTMDRDAKIAAFEKAHAEVMAGKSAEKNLDAAPSEIDPRVKALAPAQEKAANYTRSRHGLAPLTFELKRVPLASITPSQTGEDYDNGSSRELAKHVKEFGKSGREEDYAPIAVDEHGKIIDGNHRHAAAKMAGLTHVNALVPVKTAKPVKPPKANPKAAVDEARASIKALIDSGKMPTAEQTKVLADTIAGMTGAQRTDLKSRLGIKVGGAVAMQAKKIAEQALAKATPPAPKFEPREIPPPSPGTAVAIKSIRGHLEKQVHLSAEQKKTYGDAVERVFRAMPEALVKRVAAGVKKIEWHANTTTLSKTLKGNAESHSPVKVNGYYSPSRKMVALDGATQSGAFGDDKKPDPGYGTYAHEFTHALDPDFVVAKSKEWDTIWEEEIRHQGKPGSPPLGKYATSSNVEGFAEFGRALWGSNVPPEVIEKRFPKASAFFRDHHKWDTLGREDEDVDLGV